jgi:hypothetical protein
VVADSYSFQDKSRVSTSSHGCDATLMSQMVLLMSAGSEQREEKTVESMLDRLSEVDTVSG